MTAITAIFATLCMILQPATHPGVRLLLITKAKVHFDRTVTERSMPFFSLLQGSNPVQFQPSFSVFTVRSAEGRKVMTPRGAIPGPPTSLVFGLAGWNNRRATTCHREQPGAERSKTGEAHPIPNHQITHLPNSAVRNMGERLSSDFLVFKELMCNNTPCGAAEV
jgi:hypothetical protein